MEDVLKTNYTHRAGGKVFYTLYYVGVLSVGEIGDRQCSKHVIPRFTAVGVLEITERGVWAQAEGTGCTSRCNISNTMKK